LAVSQINEPDWVWWKLS